MLLNELILHYLAFLSAKGTSPDTRRCYSNQLRHYARWWERTNERPADLAAFNEPDLFAYLEAEEKRGQRPRSRYNKVSAMHSFGRWLVSFGHASVSPAVRVPVPRLDDPQRELITADDVAALLLACERTPIPARGILARAVLVTYLTSGIRRSELLNLTLTDIDFSSKLLCVRRGKGGKFRLLPLNEDAVEALTAWLAIRCAHAPTDRLFLRDRVCALSSFSLRTLLREVAAIAGLRGKTNLTPHSLRYFFTDLLAEKYTDIKTIQDLLGHANVSTTWMYIRTNMERKRRAVDGIHLPGLEPKAKPEKPFPPEPPKKTPPQTKPQKRRRISLRND